MQAGKERRGVGGLCQLQFSDGHLLTMEFKAYVILLFFFLLVTRCFQRTRDSIGTLVGEMRLLKNAMSLTVSATLTFFFLYENTL